MENKAYSYADDFKSVKCGKYHPINDFKMDEGCFFIIKILPFNKDIHVGIVNKDNKIMLELVGKTPQEIYNHICNKTTHITRMDHACYLGKELNKAYEAIKEGKSYIQE